MESLEIVVRQQQGFGFHTLLSGRGAAQSTTETEKEDSTRFVYEETSDPEGFFVPHVWALVVKATPDMDWSSERFVLFPIDDAAREGGAAASGAASSQQPLADEIPQHCE
jgi:hypothetical protein